MRLLSSVVSLMLVSVVLFLLPDLCGAAPHAHKHRHDPKPFAREATTAASFSLDNISSISLSGSASPCSGSSNCATPTVSPPSVTCPSSNNTVYVASAQDANYTVICDIDFVGQNIYPFVLASSFEDCMTQCESFNQENIDGQTRCAGFVFSPGRVHDVDDCYLKSALASAMHGTIPLEGATLATSVFIQTTTLLSTSSSSTTPLQRSPSLSLAPIQTDAAQASPNAPEQITIPTVSNTQMHGPSENNPTTQYVDHPPASPIKLASSILMPGINTDLISGYSIAGDTGTLINSRSEVTFSDLSVIPHLSRDGGKGGEINGTHIFIFCDTAGFTTSNATHNGIMVSFVSSSVAVDSGMNGLDGNALSLVDEIGEWQDNVGRLRGYAPMTTGEEAFNVNLSGNGYRYAIWPETSLIPLNATHSIQYASLVYDAVDMATQAANFTTLGNTLLTVWVDPLYGPVAQRTVNQLFDENEVPWGSVGGIRSWGSQGVGSPDGMVYAFGAVESDEGLLLSRTTPTGIADRSQYQYWTGSSWSSVMLPNSSTAYFVNGSFMDIDLFYSPHHATFIMVYLTCDADNTFYYRYLNASTAIRPSYAGGDPNSDYVENIVKYAWSEQEVLYKTPTPPVSFIYAGAVHAGYFGTDDIMNGGTKMLLSWTQHTGLDAATPESGYSHMTAAITLE